MIYQCNEVKVKMHEMASYILYCSFGFPLFCLCEYVRPYLLTLNVEL